MKGRSYTRHRCCLDGLGERERLRFRHLEEAGLCRLCSLHVFECQKEAKLGLKSPLN